MSFGILAQMSNHILSLGLLLNDVNLLSIMWTWDVVSSVYVGREVKVKLKHLGFRLEIQMWNVEEMFISLFAFCSWIFLNIFEATYDNFLDIENIIWNTYIIHWKIYIFNVKIIKMQVFRNIVAVKFMGLNFTNENFVICSTFWTN